MGGQSGLDRNALQYGEFRIVRRKQLWSAAAALGIGLAGLVVAPSPAAEGDPDPRTQGCIESVPEPDTTEPVAICYTLYKPATASPGRKAAMILHSHGWGGSRTNDAAAFAAWLEDGFGVLSFDQRGFGESGGVAHIEDPDFEGEDVVRLVDLVATLDWVHQDGPGDPRLGAIGGSYGGGYQFVGAFHDMAKRGRTRFDALAPEITWWSLNESLAPEGVPRTLWTTALYAAGAQSVPQEVSEGFAYGAVTGDWPAGQMGVAADLTAFFENNGPQWHVAQNRRLDIPVLFGQGITDNLFNLNQGLKNWQHALTPAARAKSWFIGYNGGHALPSVVPLGVGGSGDPCSELLSRSTFGEFARRFMAQNLRNVRQFITGAGQIHLANQLDGTCTSTASIEPNTTFEVAQVLSTVGVGAPLATELTKGPITITGIPTVEADVTTLAQEGRAFFALAVGATPADARIIGNNMLPVRAALSPDPVRRTIELPGIAVTVPEGQSLFLTVSPVSDMSFGHGSRLPGAMTFDNVQVHVHTQ